MRAVKAAVLFAVLAGAVSACAPAPRPVSTPVSPRFPDFVRPTSALAPAGSQAVLHNDQAWMLLEAGDLRGADREAAVALRADPDFFPAQTTAAYVALARNDASRAVSAFSRVTDAHPAYAPALAGKGLALLSAERTADAIDAFRAAVAADPSLTDLARRVDVLTLRGLQNELTVAREAARKGQWEPAVRAYRNAISASPDSGFLYRELASVEAGRGDVPAAIADVQRAVAIDASDTASLVLLGDLLDRSGDLDASLKAYTDSLALDPDPAIERRRDALRARLDASHLPESYKAIATSAQVTRADLAALIAIGLDGLLRLAQLHDVGVITDVRGHWAEQLMTSVARAGIIEPFPNHTFQPRGVVQRVDLALAVSRLLNVIASAQPSLSQAWSGARVRFSDLGAGHLAYAAVSAAVASGAMEPTADGAFRPTVPVSGAEAVAALDRVRALAAPLLTPGPGRP